MEENRRIKAVSAYVQILDDVINSDCFRGLIAASIKLSQIDAYGPRWEEHFKEKYTRLSNVLKKYRSKNSYGVSLVEYKSFGAIDINGLLSFLMDANEKSLSAREEESGEEPTSKRIRKCNEEFSRMFLKYGDIDERTFYSALMDIKECRNIVSHRNSEDYEKLAKNPDLMCKQSRAIKLFVNVIKNTAGNYKSVEVHLQELNKKDVVTETSIATKIDNLIDISNDKYCFYDDIRRGLIEVGKDVDIVAVLKGQPFLTVSNGLIIGATYPLLMTLFCKYEHLYRTEEKSSCTIEKKKTAAPSRFWSVKKLIVLFGIIALALVIVLIIKSGRRNKVRSVNATYETKAEEIVRETQRKKESENITNNKPDASDHYYEECKRNCTVAGEDWGDAAEANPQSNTDAFADYHIDDTYNYISLEISPYSGNFHKDVSVVVRILDADSEELLAESEVICKSSKKQCMCVDINGHDDIRILIRKFGGGNAYTLINNIYIHQKLPDAYKEYYSGYKVSNENRRNLTFDRPEVMENFEQDTTRKNEGEIKCEPAFISIIQFGQSGYFDLYIGNQYDMVTLTFAPDRTRRFSNSASCVISVMDPDTEEVIAESEPIVYDSKETTISVPVTGLEYIRIRAASDGSGCAETYIRDIIAEKNAAMQNQIESQNNGGEESKDGA